MFPFYSLAEVTFEEGGPWQGVMGRVVLGMAIVLGFCILYLTRSKGARDRGDARVLGYPWSVKVFVVVGFAFATVLAAVIVTGYLSLDLEGIVELWPLALYFVLWVFGLFVTLHFFFYEIRFDEHGVRERTVLPWRRARTIRWGKLNKVEHPEESHSYYLRSKAVSIRVDKYLCGREELVETAKEVLRRRRREREARKKGE